MEWKLCSNNLLGSGKSSALTPHMDALGRALAQLDNNQEYIQSPNKSNDLSFEQPFIIANVRQISFIYSHLYILFDLFFFITGYRTSCISKFDIWESFIMFHGV
jgi:hypothetical protein